MGRPKAQSGDKKYYFCLKEKEIIGESSMDFNANLSLSLFCIIFFLTIKSYILIIEY